uniref:Golgi associated, gamma adaptin ear containing, ARF binding protein 3b n=1 Tax=Cyprinus carpio TaxID=7962 RepID=A0A8C2JXF0_CYPCA
MLYSWTVVFPNEAKIADAYQTLKRQGLVKSDPELTVDKSLIPSPPTRPKNPVFDNEDMGKLLAELLRSKNPEDLQEANRLIKNMVKEDEARVQKIAKRNNTLEEVNNNVKLLSEMLSHYDRDRSSDADRELIKELYERCDKLRRTAFKLATEAEDNDSSLGDILKANDDLSRVISSYKRIVEGQADDGEGEDLRPAASEGCETTGTLIDLAGLDEPSSPPTVAPPPPLPPQVPSANPTASPIPVLPPPPRRLAAGHGSQTSSPSHKPPEQQTSLSLLDDELLSLGLNDPPSVPNRLKLDELSGQWTSLQVEHTKPLDLQTLTER